MSQPTRRPIAVQLQYIQDNFAMCGRAGDVVQHDAHATYSST
jgi:hypothetical protein